MRRIPEMPAVHPAAQLFPMMDADDLRALADDIKANGLREPVVMFGAQLLDGRNRWRACEIAGVEPELRDWSGKDAVAYVRSLNLHRRHLTPAQRAALAVKAEPVYAEAAAKKQDEGRKKGGQLRGGNHPKARRDEKSRALAQAAKETGASLDSAKLMKQVAQKAPEVVELVQRGRVETVADAKRIAELPDEVRGDVIDRVRDGVDADEAIAAAQAPSVVDQIVAASEAVDKKAGAIHRACVTLSQLCKSVGAEVASPTFAIVKTRLLRARSELSKAINLVNGETNG